MKPKFLPVIKVFGLVILLMTAGIDVYAQKKSNQACCTPGKGSHASPAELICNLVKKDFLGALALYNVVDKNGHYKSDYPIIHHMLNAVDHDSCGVSMNHVVKAEYTYMNLVQFADSLERMEKKKRRRTIKYAPIQEKLFCDIPHCFKLAITKVKAYVENRCTDFDMKADIDTIKAIGLEAAEDIKIIKEAVTGQDDVSFKVELVFSRSIDFLFDKSDIKQDQISKLTETIAFHRDSCYNCKIELHGFASKAGTDEYNEALSERRAKAVELYLIENSEILPTLMNYRYYGEKGHGPNAGRVVNILIYGYLKKPKAGNPKIIKP